jgi:hypothetical protein
MVTNLTYLIEQMRAAVAGRGRLCRASPGSGSTPGTRPGSAGEGGARSAERRAVAGTLMSPARRGWDPSRLDSKLSFESTFNEAEGSSLCPRLTMYKRPRALGSEHAVFSAKSPHGMWERGEIIK